MDIVPLNLTPLQKMYKHHPIFSFTVDLDWASEEAIQYCLELFEHFAIPVTIFMTHQSNVVSKQLAAGAIQAGIHPNFLPGSSHGNSHTEVIQYCMKLLPEAECFRAHRYYDVNDITETFYNLGLRYDSNLCTLLQKVDPFIHRSGLLRFPIYFEDGSYLLHQKCLDFSLVGKDLFSSPGLMVINIHPMHLSLNSPNFQFARDIKDKLSRQEWNTLSRDDLKRLQHKGKGIRDFIIQLLQFISTHKMECYTLKQLYEMTKFNLSGVRNFMDSLQNSHSPVRISNLTNPEIFNPVPLASVPLALQRYGFKNRSKVKIACILDEFSYEGFKYECHLIPLGLKNWQDTLVKQKPDLLLVESAWEGNKGQWRDKITNIRPGGLYSDLKRLTDWCKQHHLPTVFWAKEDPYDFDVFIEAAKYFDYVFTTDENCIPKYKKQLGHQNIFVLPFAAQPKLHHPMGKDKVKLGQVAFAGGWYNKKMGDVRLGNRNDYLLMLLRPALDYGLHIYDRFLNQSNQESKFPEEFSPYIKQSLPYKDIISIYKKYDVFLNVNSVQDSPTNFSRRVFELLASGTPVLSSYALGIEKFFPNIVKLCRTEEEVKTHLSTLLSDKELRDRLSLLGQREVFKHHTYNKRLGKILTLLKLEANRNEMPGVSIITCTKRPQCMQKVLEHYANQTYPNKELIVILNNNSMRLDDWKQKAKPLANVRFFQLDEKLTLGACLNFAVEQARFEIISKFDDDDYYGPDYLTDSVNAFHYTDAAIVGKNTVYAYLEDKKLLVLRYPGCENRYLTYVSGSTLTFKKEVFQRVKFLNQSVSEDTNFLKDALQKGYKIYATDRFNHVICRRSSLDDHSWKITEEEFLEKCVVIATTDDYQKFVTV